MDNSQLYFNSFSLFVAVVVGFVATLSIMLDARKLRGGVLEKVYHKFAIGMFIIMASFVILIVKKWDVDLVFMKLRDLLYIVGYLMLAMGARSFIKKVTNTGGSFQSEQLKKEKNKQ